MRYTRAFLEGAMHVSRVVVAACAVAMAVAVAPSAQQPARAPAASANTRLDQYKRDVSREVDGEQELIQRMNDQVFSFGELGFQEFETTKYLTGILKQNGFTIQENLPAFRRRGWRAGDRASR